MLHTLRIRDYTLIDDVEVEFDEGFNVLTGETGAGKSIVVGALNLVLGARASSEAVRDGAKQAKVDAQFFIPKPSAALEALLEEHAIETEDGALLLSRVISAQGRSKAYAGGNLVPVAVLAAIGDELVDLHGQHEHQSLLKAEAQLDLLDAYGDLESKAAGLRESVSTLRSLTKTIADLESDDRDRSRQLDFKRFEVEEINKANLEPGEDGELRSRRNLITNAEVIYTLATAAYNSISDSGEDASALDSLGKAAHAIDDLAKMDDRFAAMNQQLHGLRLELEALAEELHGYTSEVEYDPEELNDLNARLNLIQTLRRKYGETIEEILAYRDAAETEINNFDNKDARLAELRKELDQLTKNAMAAALILRQERQRVAKQLDKRITSVLHELGMESARFTTRFEEKSLASDGLDRIEFFLAANTGEKAKPLRQVASGGEISRIMLALKATFAKADKIPTLIFDEIDAGIGGAVASQVALKLAALARTHQTICITHLPQIAAAANAHYHVAKNTRGNKTYTEVKLVENATRVGEVARLLDGSVSDVSLEHARVLLETKQ